MTADGSDLDAAVAALSEESRFEARSEIAKLPRYLASDERIGVLARAASYGDDGLLAATDRGLHFVNVRSGSYFVKATTHVAFDYADVERVELDADGIEIVLRDMARPSPLLQAWRMLVQLNDWLSSSASRSARWRGLRLQGTPPGEAASLADYLGAPGGPLEGRVLDRADVRTRAALEAQQPPPRPEAWTLWAIAGGAVLAVAAIVAFAVAGETSDLCEEQPGWFLAVVVAPVIATVMVGIGLLGARSVAVRRTGRWAWLPVGAAFVLIWIGLPAGC